MTFRIGPVGVALTLGVALWGCGSEPAPQSFAVLSAFPAELNAVLEHAIVDNTVVIEGRVLRIGTINGVNVVIGMTGIGLINATDTTRIVLDNFDVTGIVFSGVAGSTLNIADVAVPEIWSIDGERYPSHQAWLSVAQQMAAEATSQLEQCTVVILAGSEHSVCLPHHPAVVVGGVGESSDPFGGSAFACQPGGGDVFGCDPLSPMGRAASTGSPEPHLAATETAIVQDMETAAVARVAAARGVPFIGFRAVSDGEGDPLGLPGFPSQFFAYYPLSAHNAAAAASLFLSRL